MGKSNILCSMPYALCLLAPEFFFPLVPSAYSYSACCWLSAACFYL